METLAVWLGIATVAFLVSTAAFLVFAVGQGELTSPVFVLPMLITVLAAASHAVMVIESLGFLPELLGLTEIRHAEWLLSTPIIAYYLLLLAGADRGIRLAAVVLDMLMIAAGYGAAVTGGAVKWAFFLASSAFFAGLLYLLFSGVGEAIETSSAASRSLLLSLRDLTVVLWLVYPVAFLLSPSGAGLITAAHTTFVYIVLDVSAKVGFVGLMLARQYELTTILDRSPSAAA